MAPYVSFFAKKLNLRGERHRLTSFNRAQMSTISTWKGEPICGDKAKTILTLFIQNNTKDLDTRAQLKVMYTDFSLVFYSKDFEVLLTNLKKIRFSQISLKKSHLLGRR